MADALTTAFMLSKKKTAHEHLKRVLKILEQMTIALKGPNMLREILFELMTRVIRKARFLLKLNPFTEPRLDFLNRHFELSMVSLPFLKGIYEEAVEVKKDQEEEVLVLYSTYTQKLIELVATVLTPYGIDNTLLYKPTDIDCGFKIDPWLISVINNMVILEYLKGEQPLS